MNIQSISSDDFWQVAKGCLYKRRVCVCVYREAQGQF